MSDSIEQKEQSSSSTVDGMPNVKLDSGVSYAVPFSTIQFLKISKELSNSNETLKIQTLNELIQSLKQSTTAAQQAIQDGVLAELLICITDKSANSKPPAAAATASTETKDASAAATSISSVDIPRVVIRQLACESLHLLLRSNRSNREFALRANVLTSLESSLIDANSPATRRFALLIVSHLIQSKTGIEQLLAANSSLFQFGFIHRLQSETCDVVRSELCNSVLSPIVRHPSGYERSIKAEIVKQLTEAIHQLTTAQLQPTTATTATANESVMKELNLPAEYTNSEASNSRLLGDLCHLISAVSIHAMGKSLFVSSSDKSIRSLAQCLQVKKIVDSKYGNQIRLHAASALVNITVDKIAKLQAIQSGLIETSVSICLCSGGSTAPNPPIVETSPATAAVKSADDELLIPLMQMMSNLSEHPESKKRGSGVLRYDAILDWLRLQMQRSDCNQLINTIAESTWNRITWRP